MFLSQSDFNIAREQCLKAVGYCRKKFKLKTISVRDLYQQAWIGIKKAVDRYDETKGSKPTYFYVWAKGEIRNYIRSRANNILSYSIREPPLNIESLETELTDDLNHPFLSSVRDNLISLFSDKEIRRALYCYKNGLNHHVLDYLNTMSHLKVKPWHKKSIVLVDYSVLCWTIFYRVIGVVDENSPQLSLLFKNNWRDEFIKIGKEFPEHQIVVGLDKRDANNSYWRHDYLPEYKGKRKAKSQSYYLCYESGRCIIEELHLNSHELDGLEFDDTAAIFSRLQRQTNALNKLVLYTIDSDLLQLVNDEYNIQFYTPRKPKGNERIQSQLRTEKEVLEYADYHFKGKIESPKDIANCKATTGEKVDNIPVGIKYLPLIDLHECWITGVKELDWYKQRIKQEYFNVSKPNNQEEVKPAQAIC